MTESTKKTRNLKNHSPGALPKTETRCPAAKPAKHGQRLQTACQVGANVPDGDSQTILESRKEIQLVKPTGAEKILATCMGVTFTTSSCWVLEQRRENHKC